jgi:2-dehydropantoate 2-reductase
MAPVFVVGAGGIGCAVGYALCQAGVAVTFVDTDREKIRWGQLHGVQVDQFPALPGQFELFDRWTVPTGATILLCTKCYDNNAVLARLPSSATLIPIQNGFDYALEASGHTHEGIASFVSECHLGRPHTRITRRGKLYLGSRIASDRPAPLPASIQRLAASRSLLAGGITVEVVPDILPYKYTKLMYNAAIGPLASAAGLDNGQLLSVPSARHLFFGLLRENYAILRGAGVTLGKVGPFHPTTVAWILRNVAVSRVLAWAFTPSLRHTYCSMSRDLPAGRTEIDYYNGRLIELAGDRPCPLNRRLYDCVKRMERERTPPGLGVLAEMIAEPMLCE